VSDRLTYDESADAAVCEYCDARFADEELLALHRGHDHPDTLSEAEREAFEAAYEAEQADIRRFRLKALGALVLLYFGFLMVYAVV
jgi:hypothetical protein